MRAILFLINVSALTLLFSFKNDKQAFSFTVTNDGVELLENRHNVFFYQKTPKSPDGKYFFSNYIHPLYSLSGDTLTEEFPADHKHHRGIFWAWHQHYIAGQSIGDGWIMDGISYNVKDVKTAIKDGNALLKTKVLWTSENWHDGEPYIEENTTIMVHPEQEGIRIIDFEISLNALVSGVSIGGSDDKKGYGGFSCRIKMPDDLTFTSETGKVKPILTQIKAGLWMDFSGTFDINSGMSGLTLICDKSNPGYPQAWILRQKNSMQNVVYPGRKRVEIPVGEPLILKYTLIIHNGGYEVIRERGIEQ